MIEINLELVEGTPQYSCNKCCSCNSVFGKSLCKVKNRGCCWYFPKFSLYDIHKMTKDEEGLKVLDKILKQPEVKIQNYYIHSKGYFDEEGYSSYMNSGQADDDVVKDKTIYFRACPFVKGGVGCDLPKKYRSYICNFFICDEITNKVENNPVFIKYIKERDSYVRWLDWENKSLEQVLHEKRINLRTNLQEVIETFKDLPLSQYEYGVLDKIRV